MNFFNSTDRMNLILLSLISFIFPLLLSLVCRCAEAASNRGLVFFGIQFYGECWSSADAAQRFFIYHSNDKCVDTEYEACDTASDKACAGVAHMNYVYELVPSKNMKVIGWYSRAHARKPEPTYSSSVRCW